MVEPNELLAASTERSTSAEVVLTLELTSFDAATSALCAFSALVWMVSVVLAVTPPSDRPTSAEDALIWRPPSAQGPCRGTFPAPAPPPVAAAGAAPNPP